MKIQHTLFALPLLFISACSNNSSAPAPSAAKPEVVCAKQGLTIGTPEYDTCVAREKGYRRMENFRKENEQQELYRDFDRARRF